MRKSISVAMAAYNGEKYIKEQVESILPQLMEDDELVVSLDPSNDSTLDILLSFQDLRIKVIPGPGIGLISNFENAIANTRNDIIFLCDQDDVWKENKVEIVLEAFENSTMVVVHDAMLVDASLHVENPSFYALRQSGSGIIKNIIKNTYIGCCMAFRKELKEHILPFPTLPMHDQYIGLAAEKLGESVFIPDALVYYRRHEGNMSELNHASAYQMIQWRIQIVKAYLALK